MLAIPAQVLPLALKIYAINILNICLNQMILMMRGYT